MLSQFFDFHFPLNLKQLLDNLLKQAGSSSGEVGGQLAVPSEREWFSQPRPSSDPTMEVLTVNFKLPLSVSKISLDVQRYPSTVEFWYKDRSNNWRRVMTRQRTPLLLTMSGEGGPWYSYESSIYPIVGKSFQVRLRRINDQKERPFSLGVRNLLIKRNIHERTEGIQSLDQDEDEYGNITSRYIKDWDASKAADDNSLTYWKSAPQPVADAVVNLFTDIRDKDGQAKVVDKIYIDPVYKGQKLNVYYSNDDTVGGRKLSPITLPPRSEKNLEWKPSIGRRDLQAEENSYYLVDTNWGPLAKQPTWFGIEWTPDFNSNNGPSVNPVLFSIEESDDLPSVSFLFNASEEAFNLRFNGGGYDYKVSIPLLRGFSVNDTLRIVVGWSYTPSKKITAKVVSTSGATVASFSQVDDSIPDDYSYDHVLAIRGVRGTLTALIIKLEDIESNGDRFLKNPQMYVSPDPVLADNSGDRPSTSLDNAIYAVDWLTQEHGTGGRDESEYSEKVWAPIWRDFIVEKGFIYLPTPTLAKYLKFEFTGLNEEPYPVYESGIDVQYRVFPVDVEQASRKGISLLTSYDGSLIGKITLNSPNGGRSLGDLFRGVMGDTYEPVKITTGDSYITSKLPHQGASAIETTKNKEFAFKKVNRRTEFEPYVISRNSAYTIIKGEGLLKIEPYTDIPWKEIYEANKGAIETTPQPGALAVRGTDWWIFPGQQLKIPASVMKSLTSSRYVGEYRASSETRTRFNFRVVHSYETRTIRRNVALAYFAGVRELTPYTSSYTGGEDRDFFDFPTLLEPAWTLVGLKRTETDVVYAPEGEGAALFELKTTSSFSKLGLNLRDTGFMSSDSMWQTEENDGLLSRNTSVTDFDGATWLDSFTNWTDSTTSWGSPRGMVSIAIDQDRVYKGRKVLRLTRQRGAGEAGIKVRQYTNLVDESQCRIRAVVYKPFDNNNEVILRFYNRITGDTIFEDVVDVPSGQWYEYVSPLFELRGDMEQTSSGNILAKDEFSVELVTRGDEPEDFYVNDLSTESSHILYYVRDELGEYVDITELKTSDYGSFVFQSPVTETAVKVRVLSDRQFVYGMTITPNYLN